jgi:hypothetical protein
MDQADSEVNEVIDAGTGTNNPMFKCGKRSCTLTAFMLPNFGKMFYTCENYVERIFFFAFFLATQLLILFLGILIGLCMVWFIARSLPKFVCFRVFAEICFPSRKSGLGIC